MQSGISASEDLQTAFRKFTSSNDQRALLVGIESETLVPKTAVPIEHDDFKQDLKKLQPHLTPTTATYILLKLQSDTPDGYAAITYVPNAAPVRQKMLFASTRLTLVRELGIERFRETVLTTDKDYLTIEGWERHEAHEGLAAPLTEEETGLEGVKAAEARESQGTSARRGHVDETVSLALEEGVVEALASLKEEGCRGTLVQLRFALPDETLRLESSTDGVAAADVAGKISATEPRYAFYSHPSSGIDEPPRIIFIYTCPGASKIKERMVYSTSKRWTRTIAERDAGLVVAESLEATEPDEVTVDLCAEGSGSGVKAGDAESAGSGAGARGGGFARPKRPGRKG